MNHPRPPGIHLGQPPRGPRPSGLVMPQGTLQIPGAQPLNAGGVPTIQTPPPSGIVPSGLPAPTMLGAPPPVAVPRHSPAQKPQPRARMMFSALIGHLMATRETVPLGNALRQLVHGNPQVFVVFTGEGKSAQLAKVVARDVEIDIPQLERELRASAFEARQSAAPDELSNAQAQELLAQALRNRQPPAARARPEPPAADEPQPPPVQPGNPPADVELDEAPPPTLSPTAPARRTPDGGQPASAHPPDANK